MPHPKVKISDDSGNAVGVTDNRLDVNVAGATMSTGDITIDSEFPAAATIADDFANPDTTSVMSMLMGYDSSGSNWNRLLTGVGVMSPSVLRVTLATDDTHFGEVGSGTAASTTGPVHGQLRYIADKSSNIATSTALSATHLSTISTLLSGPYETLGSTTYTEGVSPGNVIAAVRNDTLDALADTNNEFAPFQVNAAGALYVTSGADHNDAVVANGTQIMGEAKVIDGSGIPNTVAEGDATRLAVSRTGIQYTHLTNDSGTHSAILEEDSAHSSGDYGIMSLAVRANTLGSLVGTNEDYAPLQVNSDGALYVDGSDSTQPISGTVTANLSSTDNGVLDAIAASLALLDNSIASGNELQVDVVAALPAGTNAIGKLAANSGVDIGDVDVTSTVHPAGNGTFNSYSRFTAATSPTALTDATNGVNNTETAAKEVIIQADYTNTGYFMVGDSGATATTNGIRVNAGDTLILPVANIANIYIDASAGSQHVFVTVIK